MMPAVLLDHQRQFGFGQRPMPQPRPDQVLVGLDLCGICGSDLHVARDGPKAFKLLVLDEEATFQREFYLDQACPLT